MAKRMSMEEKRRLALQHLHESKSVFTPKELPDIWYREKKISKSAGDKVIEELEGDGLINLEKIGASKYIWAFPSEERVKNQTKLKKLEQELQRIEKETAEYEQELEAAKQTRCGADRERKLEGLDKIKEAIASRQEIADQYKDCDPAKMKEYDTAIQVAKDAAERWTDNVFAFVKWIKAQKSLSEKEIFKYFGLSEDFDYVE
mmetsp:Transcript_64442/g.102566  ORF Transcript_64442/g.102566 Transcript_64442/m.102566 type:complete len:203 (+) Transcript_64442:37-645(+)